MSRPPITPDTTREAFLTRLVHEHARLLYRVAYAVLRNPADAEDAVQDAMVKLVHSQSLPALRDERAFLARTVYRTALDRIGRRQPAGSDDEATLLLPDPRPSPETLAAANEVEAHVQRWIDELAPELRDTLLITAIDGLNSREAGDILGVPETTVRTRLHRARAILRERAEQLQFRRGRRDEVAATTHGGTR